MRMTSHASTVAAAALWTLALAGAAMAQETVPLQGLSGYLTEIAVAVALAVLGYLATVLEGWIATRAYLNEAQREEARRVLDSALENAAAYARHVQTQIVDAATVTVDSKALAAAIRYVDVNAPTALRTLNITADALRNLVTAKLIQAYMGEMNPSATVNNTTVITGETVGNAMSDAAREVGMRGGGLV